MVAILAYRMVRLKKSEKVTQGLPTWGRTVLAGLVAGAIFGLIIQFWVGKMANLGLLYGSRSLALGWITHLFHSLVGAVVFILISTRKPIRPHLTKPSHSVILGLAYGFLLWPIMTIAILPIWTSFMTPWPGRPLQNFTTTQFFGSLIGFILYGLILGGSMEIQLSKEEQHDAESPESEETDSMGASFEEVGEESDEDS